MGKFELFMGYLGNGLTVCNKAIEEHGDYKHICHIQPYGRITWYVKPESVPEDARKTIFNESEKMRSEYDSFLEKMPVYERYGYLLDNVSLQAMLDVFVMKDKTVEQKCEYLKQVLYQ